mgnify:CR=1 FL=1
MTNIRSWTVIFCDNADIADLYLDMKKDETKDSIVMVGVDATAKQQEAIRNGKEVGVVFPAALRDGISDHLDSTFDYSTKEECGNQAECAYRPGMD